MKRLIKRSEFDYNIIQNGDYVNFGSYGKLYVTNTDTLNDDYFWTTDNEEDRNNPDSLGHYMFKSDAKSIIQSYEDYLHELDEDEDED